jgi:excisionase family DNA binding protein
MGIRLKTPPPPPPRPPQPPIKTINIDTMAQRLDVSPWTVRTWIRQGKLPYTKIGRRVLIREADLDAFLREHYNVTPPIRNGRRARVS